MKSKTPERKYRIYALLLSLVLLSGLFPVTAAADTLEWPEWTLDEDEDASEHAQAAIVMDADSGLILYENNADAAYYPASITKIMTALLALENCSLDEVVTFSYDAVYNTEGSSIARDVGEEMTMEECLYGMMLASANECAYAIGEHVAGGSIDDFVDMMNEKASELGCTNTHFANSSGLPDEDHYVSARDMALIAKAAYENETFRTICGTSYYEIQPTNKHDEITYLTNHHNMLTAYTTSEYLRDYCVGGKTGYTEAAGSTLVTYAQQDGMTLICVVLSDTSPNHWEDTISLLEYYFEKCESQTVTVDTGFSDVFFDTDMAAMQASAVFLEAAEDTIDVILPTGADASDILSVIENVESSDDAGTAYLVYNGKVVGSAAIEETAVTANDWTAVAARAGSALEEEDESSTSLLAVYDTAEELVVLAVLAALSLIVTIAVKLMQRSERRREERRAQGEDIPLTRSEQKRAEKEAKKEEKRKLKIRRAKEKHRQKQEKKRAKKREKKQSRGR